VRNHHVADDRDLSGDGLAERACDRLTHFIARSASDSRAQSGNLRRLKPALTTDFVDALLQSRTRLLFTDTSGIAASGLHGSQYFGFVAEQESRLRTATVNPEEIGHAPV
jgi:hypothetical protein